MRQNGRVLFGGLAQQEPSDEKGVMARLRRLADSDEQVCYPGQYHNDQVSKPLVLWLGIKLLEELLTQGAVELEGPRAVDWSPDMEATSGSDCFLCHRRYWR